MSLRISHSKNISFTTTTPNILTNGNLNIPGYFEQNDVPINNQFYPSLSNATTEKTISRWRNGNDTSPALSSWNCITWSPELGLFCMVRQGSGTSNRIATSPDGINWITYKLSNKSYQGIVWCRDLSGIGMFVSTASNNPTGQEITISTDGVIWNDVSTPSQFFAYGALAYSPELRRVVATSYSNGYVYSDDGYNWNPVLPPGSQLINNFYSITWSSELKLFVTLSAVSNNPINVSSDGINWRYYNSSPPLSPPIVNSSISWSKELGIFCCVGEGKILISSNGENWTLYTSSNLPFRNLTWSSELGIFLGGSSASIQYSYDGINWLSRNIGFNGAKASIWSPELGYFLIGGDRFHTAISSLSGRPPTSFNVFDSSLNNINELGLWNFQSFGRDIPKTISTTPYIIKEGDNWVICTNAGGTTITLPSASLWSGREIMFLNRSTNIISSNVNNVISITGVTGNQIVAGGVAGNWSALVSDGNNWFVTRSS